MGADKMTIGINEIETLVRDELEALWHDVCASPLPNRASTAFMRRVIGFEIQRRQHGGLAKRFRKRLRAAVQKPTIGRQGNTLQTGARLMREWNGVTHVVDVSEVGYDWHGQTYRSLSAIARAITGAHWSGPRFFGLDKRP
jgi:hypothetical protein